jgi:hypothetical protein
VLRVGMPDSRTEMVILRPPDGGVGLELATFIRPDHEPGNPVPRRADRLTVTAGTG